MGNNILCYFSRSALGTYSWAKRKKEKKERAREESHEHASFQPFYLNFLVSYYLNMFSIKCECKWASVTQKRHALPWTEVTGDSHNLSNKLMATGTMLDRLHRQWLFCFFLTVSVGYIVTPIGGDRWLESITQPTLIRSGMNESFKNTK